MNYQVRENYLFLYFFNIVCFRMMELKEKMACKEAEANATIKQLSEKFGTIDVEIGEEREKRCETYNFACHSSRFI